MRGLVEQIGSFFTGHHNGEFFLASPADMLMGTLPHPRDDDDIEYDVEDNRNYYETDDEEYNSEDEDNVDRPVETQEEARKRYATELVNYIQYHFQRPIHYDTDLFCNLSQTETGDWHIPHDHVFADILNYHFETHKGQANALFFDDNVYETFFIYRYEDVMLLGKEMIQWIEACGEVKLEPTGRFKDVASITIVDNREQEEEEEEETEMMDEIVIGNDDDIENVVEQKVPLTQTTVTQTGIVTPVSSIVSTKPEQG